MVVSPRVFLARLVGVGVFDAVGERLGRVRDVVVTPGDGSGRPQVTGLVVEVAGRRRLFVPVSRVTSFSVDRIIITGVVNLRRFELRPSEALFVAELLDRRVRLVDDGARPEANQDPSATVEDLAMVATARLGWEVTAAFVRLPAAQGGRAASRFTRALGPTRMVEIHDVEGLLAHPEAQSAHHLAQTLTGLTVADIAEALHALPARRRADVARTFTDERLADVLEELPEDDQVAIIAELDPERAADVLEHMEPDDAADLLAELSDDQAAALLDRMEPGEAAPVRRLLVYAEDTAGGIMTSEPVILGPEATIAEGLAAIRDEGLAPASATTIYICRAPLETPTGRFLGVASAQRLLREPPHSAVGSIADTRVEPLSPGASLPEMTREFAAYNMLSMPVVDSGGRLLGAVTVDDLIDHLLPDDWRQKRQDTPDE
ncbi:MAG: CBS domain-containing protein [Dermatophilaceae bacterium]